jgi:hypothetical protein
MDKNAAPIMCLLWFNIFCEARQAGWEMLAAISVTFASLGAGIIVYRAINEHRKTK